MTIQSPATQSAASLNGTGAAVVTGTLPDDPASDLSQTTVSPDRYLTVRRKALLRFAISITVLNLVGHLLLGFEQPPFIPILAVVVSYAASLLFEAIDSWAYGRPAGFAGSGTDLLYFLLPAHIAALACAMLVYSSTIWPYLFAVVASAGSKYLFRVRVGSNFRHYMNPSNFGIALALLLIPTLGFTPPYMFLNETAGPVDILIPLGVLIAGTLLNSNLTRRMPLIAAWVGGYVAQGLVRSWLFDDPILSVLGSMTGVAFILFTNYMITDPGTTPTKSRNQVYFGLAAATIYGLLIAAGISYAIFFCLTLTCALRGLMLTIKNLAPAR